MDNFAALQWQWEMGVTDIIGTRPYNWLAPIPAAVTENKFVPNNNITALPLQRAPASSPVADLSGVASLGDLRSALESFEGLSLRKTATRLVFGEGVAKPDIMIIGEAPGADEDRQGRPFVGASGQLLDKMLAAIGASRATNTYITNVIHWRPPGNRSPTPQEITIALPFVQKHIELIRPKVLMVMGGVAAKAMFDISDGITRARGRWMDYALPDGTTIPALITFHPAYLLRAPQQKALAWQDLQSLQARLGNI